MSYKQKQYEGLAWVTLSTFILLLVSACSILPTKTPLSCDEIFTEVNTLLGESDVSKSEFETFIGQHYRVDYQRAGNSLLWKYQGKGYEAGFTGNSLEIIFIDLEHHSLTGNTVVDCFGVPDKYKAEVSVGHESAIFEFNLFYEGNGLRFLSGSLVNNRQDIPKINDEIIFDSIRITPNNESPTNNSSNEYSPWVSWQEVNINIDPALEPLLE